MNFTREGVQAPGPGAYEPADRRSLSPRISEKRARVLVSEAPRFEQHGAGSEGPGKFYGKPPSWSKRTFNITFAHEEWRRHQRQGQ